MIGIKWKLFTGLAVVGLAAALIALTVAYIEKRSLAATVAKLDSKINDPVAGYVVKLAQAETNTAQIQSTVARSLAAYQAKAADDERRLAETTRQLAIAQSLSSVARRQSTTIMATPNDLAAVDAAILETLK